jgi:hypothetical protein
VGRQAGKLCPSDAGAYYNLGLLLHEKPGCNDQAEAAYPSAIKLNALFSIYISYLAHPAVLVR